MTHRINFSHNYPKLHGQRVGTLLAVIPIRIDRNTPQELLDYDTTYHEENGYRCHFPLLTGDYIQLVFVGNLHIPFCTIRKAWPRQKVDYYKAAIGHDFVIHIEEGGAK